VKIKLTLIIKSNHSYSVIVFFNISLFTNIFRRFTGISDEIDLQNYFKLKKFVCSFISTTIRIFYDFIVILKIQIQPSIGFVKFL